MNKSCFWKIISLLEEEGDIETVHWFEAMCLSYAMDPVTVDELAKCLAFYDLKEENV